MNLESRPVTPRSPENPRSEGEVPLQRQFQARSGASAVNLQRFQPSVALHVQKDIYID